MPNKLKNLKVTKVDFVDAGANQRANVLLFKHAPEGGEKVEDGKFKRLLQSIAKRFNMQEDEVIGGLETITKGDGDAKTFSDKNSELQQGKICEEIWDITDALRSSLISIIRDESVEDCTAMLKQSFSEFNTAALGFADKWGAGNVIEVQKYLKPVEMSDVEMEIAKKKSCCMEKSECGVPASPDKKTSTKADTSKKPKIKKSVPNEEEKEMKIDKSKMTPAEKVFFEDIEKRYAMNDGEEGSVEKHEPEPEKKDPVKKSAQEALKEIAPELASMLEGIQKRAEKAEDDEMLTIAKRYEILGKKPEELAPVLKSTKAANEEVFNQVIAAMDSAVDIAKKSGMFDEVGHNGQSGDSDAWGKVAKCAAEIKKAHPDMSDYEAKDLAFQQNPELVAECE